MAASSPFTSSPPRGRIVTLIALAAVPIFLTISLGLTLKAIYDPSFAVTTWQTQQFDATGQAFWTPTDSVLLASPFYNCTAYGPIDPATLVISSTATAINVSCERRPFLGAAGLAACPQSANGSDLPGREHICQKVTSSASLYVAGAVLIGLATLGAWIVAVGRVLTEKLFTTTSSATVLGYVVLADTSNDAAEGAKHHHDNDHHHHHRVGDQSMTSVYAAPTTAAAFALRLLWSIVALFTVLGAGCVVMGQVVGVDALVNDQLPGPDPTTSTNLSRWYMGEASLVFTTAGYVFAVVAAMICASRYSS